MHSSVQSSGKPAATVEIVWYYTAFLYLVHHGEGLGSPAVEEKYIAGVQWGGEMWRIQPRAT